MKFPEEFQSEYSMYSVWLHFLVLFGTLRDVFLRYLEGYIAQGRRGSISVYVLHNDQINEIWDGN
jgi:hypothetical protein